MNDHAERELLHGYLDGELDLVRGLEIEAHLRTCPDCSREYKSLEDLRSSLRSALPYHTASARLRKRLDSMIGRETDGRKVRLFKSWPGVAVGATFALASTMLWLVGTTVLRAVSENSLAQEVLSSHVRSLMENHLTDVISSDLHTVKPWFKGRLEFSPAVKDLAAEGFPLVGGRLDYVDNRPVAALVFRRREHFINLLTWSSDHKRDERVQSLDKQGYHLFYWTQSGMTYWVVSDLNEKELQDFIGLYR